MASADSETQRQLINSARAHAAESIRAFVAAAVPQEPVKASCERAAAVLDRYCCDLLDHMLAAIQPTSADDTAWVRSQYLTLIVEFGCAVRDAIADSETRHAAAQGIQYRVLEHERHLRVALESAALANSPVVEITPPTPADPPLPKPGPYVTPDITPETV
jgi:hypothetical protein